MAHLNKIQRNFFWKQSASHNGLPLIAWDKVCTPKSKGGLGLRKSEAVNTAFQCKLAWRILMDGPSLWVQVMHAKYLRKESFFEYSRKSTDSLVWRNMIWCIPLLQQGIRWKLGRGNKIRFWFGNWLDEHNLLDLLNFPSDVVSNPHATVSDFIAPKENGM